MPFVEVPFAVSDGAVPPESVTDVVLSYVCVCVFFATATVLDEAFVPALRYLVVLDIDPPDIVTVPVSAAVPAAFMYLVTGLIALPPETDSTYFTPFVDVLSGLSETVPVAVTLCVCVCGAALDLDNVPNDAFIWLLR